MEIERLNDSVPLESIIKYLVIEKGKSESYIQELEYNIEELKKENNKLFTEKENLLYKQKENEKLDKYIKKELKKDQILNAYLSQIKALEKKNKELVKKNSELINEKISLINKLNTK